MKLVIDYPGESSSNNNIANVNEEYEQAFRTKSFIDISKKAQNQLGKIESRTINTCSPPPNTLLKIHLTDYLLEPRQETVTNITKSFNAHHLLVDYFQASLEACQYCDQILERIHQVRLSHRKITRLINKLITNIFLHDDDDDQTQKDMINTKLALFASQPNPLAFFSPSRFRDIHDRYTVLLRRLKSRTRKIRRRIAFKILCKKIGGIGLVISYTTLLIATLILAIHSIVGIVAAPGILGGLLSLCRKKFKGTRAKVTASCSENLCDQLDVAARGVYILINDLDTMSRMVRRLNDEVEHTKAIADVGVKSGKWEILKQVMKEFQDRETSFLDQMQELEEHIYLCFLTINRSRRLVIEEIMEKQHERQ